MMNRLRIFNTPPGRFRLTKGCQLLPTTPLLLFYSPQNKISNNTTKTFLSSQPSSTRRISTARDSFEADKLCSEIGIQNIAGKETAAVNETSPVSSNRSHQAKGRQGRESSVGKGQGDNKKGNNTKQAQHQSQTHQIVDQMNPNHFGYQSGYPPIYQRGYAGQQQQQQSQQHQNQQQWFSQQQEQYGMGYAPPPGVVGYGFLPPAFAPGLTGMPLWQQPPPPPFYSGAEGRRGFSTNTNTNHASQPPQPDYYRSRSPRGNSRGGQYNNYNSYNNNNTRPDPDYYRPGSPVGPYSGGGGRRYNNTRPESDSYRPGPYSRGRQYHSDTRAESYRPRSPGPYSREYNNGGQYNNNNNNNNNNNSNSNSNSNSYNQHQQQQHQQQQQQQLPSKPPKLNKKAKAREAAAAREALSQSQAGQRPSMMPSSLFNQQGDIPREASDPIVPPSAASGGVPNPSEAYLSRASFPPCTIPKLEKGLEEGPAAAAPRPMLVVIDLNGTLLHRPSRKRPSKFVERPFAKDFLRYCLEHYQVVIWSSARPVNVKLMCRQLLTAKQLEQVVAIWGRDKFGLTSVDYNARVQCYKRLTMLWADEAVMGANPLGEVWDQGNTVLIDDSAEKARSEPYNCITLPEFVGDLKEKPEVLPMVLEYLDTLAHQEDISRYIRVKPFDISVDSSKAVTGDEGVALASPPAAAQAEGSG